MRTPILLDDGLVYSVVSDVPDTSGATLRAAAGSMPSDVIDRYTELPSDLPERDVRLAERITRGASTTFERERFASGPPDPSDVDAAAAAAARVTAAVRGR
jgi:hypothetical protein